MWAIWPNHQFVVSAFPSGELTWYRKLYQILLPTHICLVLYKCAPEMRTSARKLVIWIRLFDGLQWTIVSWPQKKQMRATKGVIYSRWHLQHLVKGSLALMARDWGNYQSQSGESILKHIYRPESARVDLTRLLTSWVEFFLGRVGDKKKCTSTLTILGKCMATPAKCQAKELHGYCSRFNDAC